VKIKDVFNSFRTHLRKNYPEEYRKSKINEDEIDEISATGGSATFTPGTGMNYATPYAFSKVKNINIKTEEYILKNSGIN
jgi:hypothetical protein